MPRSTPIACPLSTNSTSSSFKFQDNVEREPAPVIHKVGSGDAIADKGKRISGNGEGDLLPSCDTRKVDTSFLPVYRERVLVIARRTKRGLRPVYFTALLGKGNRRLNGLCRFLPRLNVQVGNKSRAKGFAVSVGEFVERVGIPFPQTPAFRADKIERLRELAHRFHQAFGLFRCGV